MQSNTNEMSDASQFRLIHVAFVSLSPILYFPSEPGCHWSISCIHYVSMFFIHTVRSVGFDFRIRFFSFNWRTIATTSTVYLPVCTVHTDQLGRFGKWFLEVLFSTIGHRLSYTVYFQFYFMATHSLQRPNFYLFHEWNRYTHTHLCMCMGCCLALKTVQYHFYGWQINSDASHLYGVPKQRSNSYIRSC